MTAFVSESNMNRQLILYIAVTIDGFIARENGAIDWLDPFEASGNDYGYREFIAGIDTVIMGRKTYEQILTFNEFPYPDQKCYVLTRRPEAFDDHRVQFYSGSAGALMKEIRKTTGAGVWLIGGAEVAQGFLREDLIDSYIISIIPVLLGSGIRLFDDGKPEMAVKFVDGKSYDDGIVQVSYERLRPS